MAQLAGMAADAQVGPLPRAHPGRASSAAHAGLLCGVGPLGQVWGTGAEGHWSLTSTVGHYWACFALPSTLPRCRHLFRLHQ